MAENSRSKLKLAVIIGFLLSLILVVGVGFISFYSGEGFFPSGDSKAARESALFYRSLAEYDNLWERSREARNLTAFSQMLDKLEKQVKGAEFSRSILKRRRILAREDSRFIIPYREAAQNAASAFPRDVTFAALAAEAVIFDPSTPPKKRRFLDTYISRLSASPLANSRFASLILAIRILEGNMKSPQQAAAAIPWDTLANVSLTLPPGRREKRLAEEQILMDAAILKILERQTEEARGVIDKVLEPPPVTEAPVRSAFTETAIISETDTDSEADNGDALFTEDETGEGVAEAVIQPVNPVENAPILSVFAPSPDFLRFAAEFFYDFGPVERTAQLLSSFSDTGSLIRRADAFYLAGDIPAARNGWALLDASEGQAESVSALNIIGRSRYNLALTSNSNDMEKEYLEKLISTPVGDKRIALFGNIRYSRLFDTMEAIAILEEQSPRENPLIELELLRRRLPLLTAAKSIPETWLLLEHHPGNLDLYRWALYYFEFQKEYREIAILLNQIDMQKIKSPWLDIHYSLEQIRGEKFQEAEKILRAIPLAVWVVPANIGRILEYQHSNREALENYEKAWNMLQASKKMNTEDASGVQLRMSHIYRLLGRTDECRKALQLALELDPKNINAQLELDRMDFQNLH
ncbi:MAG: tetratricopeptide repeat protein [Treponema sp.]|jgi:tetratricopeptide (TPR) repeat protein|nr:tetratricopeptide repeat protein [Treponema sp.]